MNINIIFYGTKLKMKLKLKSLFLARAHQMFKSNVYQKRSLLRIDKKLIYKDLFSNDTNSAINNSIYSIREKKFHES